MGKAKKYLSNGNIQESIVFFIMSIALIAYSLSNHYGTKGLEWIMSPYLFPTLISIFLMCLSVSLFLDGKYDVNKSEENKVDMQSKWISVLITVIAVIIYYFIVPKIGFVISTIIFLCSMLIFLGERRWFVIAIISIVTSVSIYFIFAKLLHVMLP